MRLITKTQRELVKDLSLHVLRNRWSRAGLIVVITIVLVFFGVIYVASYSAHSAVRAERRGEARWIQRIKAVGATSAYKEFAASVENLPRWNQHGVSHDFGAALYDSGGDLGACASDDVLNGGYLLGCPHEFIGRSIADNGIAIISKLWASCQTLLGLRSLWCEHSLGHGIVTSIGYTIEDLKQALGFCAQIGTQCYEAAFMEFNVRTMLGGDASVRSPKEEGLYYPCYSFDKTYSLQCVNMLPHWWYRMIYDSNPSEDKREIIRQLGGRCQSITDPVLERSCYTGIGFNMWLAVTTARDVEGLCDSVGRNGKHALYCREGAANIFFNLDGASGPASANTICDVADKSEKELCMYYANHDLFL